MESRRAAKLSAIFSLAQQQEVTQVTLAVRARAVRRQVLGLADFEHFEQVTARDIAPTGLDGSWWFRDFVDSPDPRFRQIVRRFADAGFLKRDKDEFAAGT